MSSLFADVGIGDVVVLLNSCSWAGMHGEFLLSVNDRVCSIVYDEGMSWKARKTSCVSLLVSVRLVLFLLPTQCSAETFGYAVNGMC